MRRKSVPFLPVSNKIENPLNIKNSSVFIFFGKKDSMLAPGVTDKANAFYTNFGANLKYY